MLKPEHLNLQHLSVLDADPEIDVKSSKKRSFLKLVPCKCLGQPCGDFHALKNPCRDFPAVESPAVKDHALISML